MMRKHGPWTIKKSTPKYKGQFVEVNEDQVIKPDGQPGTYSIVKIEAGASVLPLDTEGFVYLVESFRYALGRDSIEVASGTVEDDEQPIESAKRELREELGIEADDWVNMGQVDPITSIVQSPAYIFFATKLSFTETDREGSEVMKTVKVRLDEAVKMVMKGEITHGTSCTLILKVNNYLQNAARS